MQASVVIVSWHRPEALKRCLLAVSQLQGVTFEVIVVADPTGLEATRSLPFHDALKLFAAPEANISKARNIGVQQAAGEVVAFLDDDAAAEPSWLKTLISPLLEPDIHAAGGFVRGRNGISWQWRGRRVDRLGNTERHDPEAPIPDGWAIKTEGTNMAVRRAVLLKMGGFDPSYAYFLDETDLNLRMGLAGLRTKLVPEAEVHHGFQSGPRRRADRVPRDLFDQGHSWAIFLRKFAEPEQVQPRLEEIRASLRRTLLGHMIFGRLEPRDIAPLLARLDAGIAAGRDRPRATLPELAPGRAPFLPFPVQPRHSRVLTCRPITAARTRQTARRMVDAGEIVTVLNFSASALFHHVRFHPDGFWEQSGGLFGKSERSQPLARLWTRPARRAQEVNRVRNARLIDD